jgi:hypothetical protein
MKIKTDILYDYLKSINAVITKDTGDTILLHCIFPHHKDTNRSAVIYTNDSIYFCPACGKHSLTKIIGGKLEYEYTERNSRKQKCDKPYHFHDKFAECGYFYDYEGNLVFANIQNGVCLGTGKRVRNTEGFRRGYYFEGQAGFRLNSRYITESTTDAIRLVEAGIDAGSVCSVSNVKKVQNHQTYIPQIDKVGIDAGLYLQRKGIYVFWWNKLFEDKDLAGIKDICDLSLEKFNYVLQRIL